MTISSSMKKPLLSPSCPDPILEQPLKVELRQPVRCDEVSQDGEQLLPVALSACTHGFPGGDHGRPLAAVLGAQLLAEGEHRELHRAGAGRRGWGCPCGPAPRCRYRRGHRGVSRALPRSAAAASRRASTGALGRRPPRPPCIAPGAAGAPLAVAAVHRTGNTGSAPRCGRRASHREQRERPSLWPPCIAPGTPGAPLAVAAVHRTGNTGSAPRCGGCASHREHRERPSLWPPCIAPGTPGAFLAMAAVHRTGNTGSAPRCGRRASHREHRERSSLWRPCIAPGTPGAPLAVAAVHRTGNTGSAPRRGRSPGRRAGTGSCLAASPSSLRTAVRRLEAQRLLSLTSLFSNKCIASHLHCLPPTRKAKRTCPPLSSSREVRTAGECCRCRCFDS
ncbi:uncharacterized protein GJ701_012009 [Geothlypis trichas]